MGSTWGDANDAMPRGYHPHRVTEPPRVDLDATTTIDDGPVIVTKDNAAEEIQRLLKDADRRRGTIAVALGVLGTGTSTAKERASAARLAGHAEQELAHIGDRLKRAMRAAALLVPALLVAVGLAEAPVGGQAAQAAEAPQPDPVAVASATYRVVDTARPVVNVRTTTYNVTPEGLHCASVWATSPRLLSFGPAHLGSACSISSTFTVRVVLDGAALPLGRSTVVISDDAAPLAAAPAQAILDVRRASKFGRGVWTDAGQGYLTIAAPLQAYSPAAGRWLPQNPPSRVRVLQLISGRWVVKAVLTARNGMAYGAVHFAPGARVVVKVDHPADAKSWATSGMAHAFDLSPSDPPTDVI